MNRCKLCNKRKNLVGNSLCFDCKIKTRKQMAEEIKAELTFIVNNDPLIQEKLK